MTARRSTAIRQDFPNLGSAVQALSSRAKRLAGRLWTYGLDNRTSIRPAVGWPLWLVPFLLVSQLVSPGGLWLALAIALTLIYGTAYAWVRIQVAQLEFECTMPSRLTMVGDTVEVQCRVANPSSLPVIWCEFLDSANPRFRFAANRVVACPDRASTEWTETVLCQRRGWLRLGPVRLRLGDPLGLMEGTRAFAQQHEILVYPRIVRLPECSLVQQVQSGSWRQRRRLQGAVKAPILREYTPADSLRHVHWPSTARRGELTVTELETEPGVSMTVALDLKKSAHVGDGPTGTLEFSIMIAGSLVAQVLDTRDQSRCGLLCAGSDNAIELFSPVQGPRLLWHVVHALAGIAPGEVTLANLLNRTRRELSQARGNSVMVVAAFPSRPDQVGLMEAWVSELASLQQAGVACGVILCRFGSGEPDVTLPGPVETALAAFEPRVFDTSTAFEPVLTHRRQTTRYITTPFGGTVAVTEQELVG